MLEVITATVLGFFAQPLIAILKDVKWSTGGKTILAAIVSLVLGLGIALLFLKPDAEHIISFTGIVFTVANLMYNLVMKGSGLQNTLERVNVLSPFDTRSKQEIQKHEDQFEPAPMSDVIDTVLPIEEHKE